MDTLTHALSGALLGRATAPAHPAADEVSVRGRVVAGALAAAFPDIDFVLGYVSPIVYLEAHRGVTHSILLLPLWALFVAWICAKVARDPRGAAPWFGVCALGVGVHIAGDYITSFGTMILAPVSKARFGVGTTFIIDLWFTGIILAGLALSIAWRRSRAPAIAASLALAGYVGLQAYAKSEAVAFGERYASAQRLAPATVEAHPRPVSPFNWTVFVSHGESIAFSHVNVRRREAKPPADAGSGFIARLDAAYRPLEDAQWNMRTRFGESVAEQALARSAWNASELAFFRWFADLPAFDGITPGSSCVWFRDLRFETPGRSAVPFRYGVCREGEDRPWRLFARDDAGVAHRVER